MNTGNSNPAINQRVVIRRPLWGNILFILACAAFVAIGMFLRNDEDGFIRFIAYTCIAFFGGGGLLYVVLMMRKPIVVITREGVTVPYGWGSNFVPWEHVTKIEVVTQTVGTRYAASSQKYIGIFAPEAKGTVGAGKFSQTVTQAITQWEEVPTMLITLSFSFTKIEKVMEVLQLYHEEYRRGFST